MSWSRAGLCWDVGRRWHRRRQFDGVLIGKKTETDYLCHAGMKVQHVSQLLPYTKKYLESPDYPTYVVMNIYLDTRRGTTILP